MEFIWLSSEKVSGPVQLYYLQGIKIATSSHECELAITFDFHSFQNVSHPGCTSERLYYPNINARTSNHVVSNFISHFCHFAFLPQTFWIHKVYDAIFVDNEIKCRCPFMKSGDNYLLRRYLEDMSLHLKLLATPPGAIMRSDAGLVHASVTFYQPARQRQNGRVAVWYLFHVPK